jgi:hypothetical protein
MGVSKRPSTSNTGAGTSYSKSRPNTTKTTMTQSTSFGTIPKRPKKVEVRNASPDSEGVANFDYLPLGNYCLEFRGNKCFKPAERYFDVSGSEANMIVEMDLEVVDNGFVLIKVSMDDSNHMKNQLETEMEDARSSGNLMDIKNSEERMKKWSEYTVKLKRYQVNVTRYSENDDGELSLRKACNFCGL